MSGGKLRSARGRSDRRSGGAVVAALAAGLFVAGSPTTAGAEAASLGYAGAFSLRARGVEAPAWNPATLAWSAGFDARLVSLGGTVQNSAFSTGDYGRWNGADWSDADKEAILARIGDSFEGAFSVAAEGPGVAWRRWALTSGGRTAGFATLPGEYAKLLLYGNDPEESYDLGGSDAEAIAWSELRLSHARSIGALRLHGEAVACDVGFNLKYLRGWGYGEVTRAEGSLVTTPEGIFGEQFVAGRTAEGGNGFACDLGAALPGPGVWRFGLTVRNIYSTLRWARAPRARTESARADSVTLSEGEQGEDLVTTESTDRPMPAFHRSLPGTITLAAFRSWGEWDGEADLQQGWSRRAGTSTTPRLSLGVRRSPWRWLEGRAGFALGGEDGPLLAAGLGLAGWKLRFDLAAATAHGIDFTDPHGFSLGTSLGLRWESADSPVD